MSETMELNRHSSESMTKFAPAFVKAQSAIEGAVKDSTNPHFKSKYADLASVMGACKKHLNENGIAVIQRPAHSPDGNLALETVLLHESGEWISGEGEIPLVQKTPQAYGSALTYARRYFLAAIVGVCPEDDDGEGAEGRKANQNAGGNGDGRKSAPEGRAPQGRTNTRPPAGKNESAEPFKMPDSLEDAETFKHATLAAFKTRKINTKAKIEAAMAFAAKTVKVEKISDLVPARRKGFITAILSGTYDRFAGQAQEGAQQ